jgi:hypothetical protein
LAKPVFKGVVLLFAIQLTFQIVTIFLQGEYKGGLINIRMLLWDGLQTWPVVLALFRHLLVYLLILVFISAVSAFATNFMVKQMRLDESAAKLMTLNLLLLYAALMVINLYRYPNSLVRVAVISDWQVNGDQAPFYLAVTFLFVLSAAAAVQFAIWAVDWWRNHSTPNRRIVLTVSALFIGSLLYLQLNPDFQVTRSTSAKPANSLPNIILIGLDSVRLDIIKDENLRATFLPELDQFLKQEETTWFPNAYTPIARTFAAWYAILTGEEPRKSGVRYNLQPLTPGQKDRTIVHKLRENGYYTIYGSDEKRFSAIDESFGFHETLGPSPGASEWVLSILEDTPLHNILRDNVLAPFLFPQTYGNRASFTVHKPEHFVSLVERQLSTYEHLRPLFLSIHLCLSHWPYRWSTGQTHVGQSQVRDYFDTLEPLDRQFGDIMHALRKSGMLQNSVVMVFTDHGEGLVSNQIEEDDPRWEDFRSHFPQASDISLGHGSDLLTITQNQIMLSIQDHTGKKGMRPGKNDRFTSLLDITPTVARYAQVENFESDGIDLASDGAASPGKRVIFLETGIDLEALHQARLNIDDLIKQGVSAYEIDRDGLLQIREAYHNKIIGKKQKGVTDGQFILSNDPKPRGDGDQRPKFIALDINDPQKVITSIDFDANPDLSYLRDELERYYGKELLVK